MRINFTFEAGPVRSHPLQASTSPEAKDGDRYMLTSGLKRVMIPWELMRQRYLLVSVSQCLEYGWHALPKQRNTSGCLFSF
jgi:hypothetical protein